MEKFGIFELLDALSALTAQNGPAPPEAAGQSAEPRRPDGAFDPPAYAKEEDRGQGQKADGRDALAGFLARHDAVARKAEKK